MRNKMVRIALAIMLLIAACSVDLLVAGAYNCTKSKRKQTVPLWIRREHYEEERGWAKVYSEPDPQDVEYLAIAIYCEAGADYISDKTRYMVGDVILNRVNDNRFPDSIYAVLTQKSQYGRFYWTGIIWPDKAENDAETQAVGRAREIAYNLLTGVHSALYNNGYVFQAEFRQGTEQIESDNIFFGR